MSLRNLAASRASGRREWNVGGRRPLVGLLVAGIFLGGASGVARAATVGTGLEAELASVGGEELLPVVIHFPNQMHGRELHDRLRAAGLNMAARHRELMGALQEFAARQQAPWLEWLQAEEASGAGDLERVRPHWLANVISVAATPAGVALLAESLPADMRLALHRAQPVLPVPMGEPPAAQSKHGHDWNLDQVRAPYLWAMGIHGEGTIVANLDTGVDGAHSLLAARWRGEEPGVEPGAAWLSTDGSTYPTDSGSHGTHTMGTITGGADGDTVGVAPAAQWIAAQMNFGAPPGVEPYEGFEWCADPDGNPETFDDVPDVVSNSWGYVTFDCVNWDAVEIDNMELLGVVGVFAAGNESAGGNPRTVIPPASRADDLVTNFAVGATTQGEGIASFSSRGPTTCLVADSLAIKPEVSAPGVSVRSTTPREHFANYSGTSMATPHVAGAVALIRQIMPEMTAEEVKLLLWETARHPGGPGLEDNNYGRGIVDVEAAAERLFAEYDLVGEMEVTVLDGATGLPLERAAVILEEANLCRLADDSGQVHFDLLAGDYTLRVEDFTHREPAARVVSVEAGGSAVVEVRLVPMPEGTISGQLTGVGGGAPGVAARIRCVRLDPDTLLAETESDASGQFSVATMVGDYRLEVAPLPPYRFYEEHGVVVDSAAVSDLSRQVELANVLLVDAEGESSDYAPEFVALTLGAERSYNHWDRHLDGAAVAAVGNMPANSAVVWFSGDAESGLMDAAEETALVEHLETGGGLFLTGRDLVRQIDGGALLQDALGMGFVASTNEHYVPVVMESELGGMLGEKIFTTGFLPPVNQLYQDVISGGAAVANYDAVDGGAALVTGAVSGGRAVVAGFGLEGVHGELPGGVSREAMLRAVLDWLSVPLGLTGDDAGDDGDGHAPALAPEQLKLGQNRPNPFNPRTLIPVDLAAPGEVRLRIFDTRGALVATLVDGALSAGHHAFLWEGRSDQGLAVASGLYFAVLEAGGRTSSRKMILLK
jgi:subtilisin family serine protease